MLRAMVIWMVLIPVCFGQDIRLEFKIVKANLPGVLGSVTYQTIWASSEGMRIDSGAISSKIITKDGTQVFEFDHDLKEYCPIVIDKSESEEIMAFRHANPFVQSWNSMSCEVFEHHQQAGEVPFHFRIWFSDLGQFPMENYLAIFLDLDQSVSVFPDGPPNGFPVRATLEMMLDGKYQQVLELCLEHMVEMDMPVDALKIPNDYTEIDCQGTQ